MPWFTSWLPGLPNLSLAIPTSIQGRFISFVLKKSLGHLLKPDQLDYHQIDSQIGSGYVQINDLELSPEAINAHLDGQPIVLQEGSLSSVKVRVPWPNPLASTLGFSLASLHLTFNLVLPPDRPHEAEINLADSVASAASSFFDEEISPTEEALLWQSIHQNQTRPPTPDPIHPIPGSLGGSQLSGQQALDSDPAGVSVFAGLIERLLARFEFDAHDVRVTLVHPDNMRVTFLLQEIRYHTESKAGGEHPTPGEVRALTLNGLKICTTDLTRPSASVVSITPPANTSRPASRTSSKSSFGDDAQMSMSQSILSLPPRTPSPASSVSSDMYQSALDVSQSRHASSEADDVSEATASQQQLDDPQTPPGSRDELILSSDSRPIIIRLITPPPTDPECEVDVESPTRSLFGRDEVHLQCTMYTITCGLKPWQLRGLMQISQAFASEGGSHSQKSHTSNLMLPPLNINLHIRAITLFLSPHELFTENSERNFVPYYAEGGYTRLYLDTVDVTTRLSSLTHDENPRMTVSTHASLLDFSLFCFTRPDGSSPNLKAFPLLITDPHLPSQYSCTHVHPEDGAAYPSLPSFQVQDWVRSESSNLGTKVSQWRVKSPSLGETPAGPHLNAVSQVALKLHMNGQNSQMHSGPPGSQNQGEFEIDIAPLHLRLDLDILFVSGGIFSFFEQVLPLSERTERENTSQSQVTSAHSIIESPFQDPSHEEALPPDIAAIATDKEREIPSSLAVSLPFVRVSLRCPPPKGRTHRSGVLVVDLCNTKILNGLSTKKATSREDLVEQEAADRREGSPTTLVHFSRAVLGISTTGADFITSFVSLGALMGHNKFRETGHELPEELPFELRPCIRLFTRTSSTANVVVASNVPSIHVDLSKEQIDGLQYLADDLTQFMEQLSGRSGKESVFNDDSRNASLVGSRFFTGSRTGSALTDSSNASSEAVIQLAVTETFVRLRVPRSDKGTPASRPFDIITSDLDLLVELNPDGKQQTLITLAVINATISNTDGDDSKQKFFSLTTAHSLATTPKAIVNLRVSTSTMQQTNSKETRIKVSMAGFTYTLFPDLHWVTDLAAFAKNPPGTFESVIPSDRTRISVNVQDGSIRCFFPNRSGGLVAHLQDLGFATDVVEESQDSTFHINASSFSLLALDEGARTESSSYNSKALRGVAVWTSIGYALIADISELDVFVVNQLKSQPCWKVDVHRVSLRLHLCADTLMSVSDMVSDLGTLSKSGGDTDAAPKGLTVVDSSETVENSILVGSLEDLTFQKAPEIGPAPDMINDDLPTNLDYLDDSFGAAAGLREIRDDDLDDFSVNEIETDPPDEDSHVTSRVGGETIKVFEPECFEIVEDHFLTISPDTATRNTDLGEPSFCARVFDGNFVLFLYDGYDWAKTRKTIEEEVKEMRKRLAKIRQLVANGHTQEAFLEDTSVLLYNSLHIGLDEDEDALGEPAALIAAIDRELKEDAETISWQSLPTFQAGSKSRAPAMRVHGKRLTRSRSASMEFSFNGLRAEFDQFQRDNPLVSRTFVSLRDVEILDHIKTSTWKKFLTELRADSRGNIRETDSDMVRIELRNVRPVLGHDSEEVRVKAKILPLRLYVDQDAVDFLKKFFSFKDPHITPDPESSHSKETYIQHAEVFPIDLKLDYKPRRVDYRALREGRTIELMNFFHFDGAEMTLRHITVAGVTGWGKFFELLNDLWTPDVKATQLVEVISGVAPIRSIVNVGSGVADLVLLPIAQYKKDGRIVRGVQKGATAFVKSTAIEAIKMGAKLATGTQVILEQAEGILGGQTEPTLTAEPLQFSPGEEFSFESDGDDEEGMDFRSKYAQQPADIREGVQSAYKSLQRNLNSAAQTILAVPMEVYEKSGSEGPVRSVIRAVPIAVLKPMIGASEAVSKTLQGLHNTLDSNVRHENEAKYKR